MESEHISVQFILRIFGTQSFFVVSVAMYVLDSFSERMVSKPVPNCILIRKKCFDFSLMLIILCNLIDWLTLYAEFLKSGFFGVQEV